VRVVAAVCLLGLVVAAAGARLRGQATETNIPLKGDNSDLIAVQVTFAFVPRTEGEPRWTITVNPDRSGSYGEQAEGAVSQPLQVSPAVWQKLQAGVAAVRKGACETRQKGIAQTGRKTFTFVLGPSAPVSCTFNYSDVEALNEAANDFLALAEMVQEGAKLQRDHRYDRLALDADMDALLGEVGAGRAVEPGNIAPVLQAIVDDDRVIERVRRKAARLLQSAVPAAAALPDKPE